MTTLEFTKIKNNKKMIKLINNAIVNLLLEKYGVKDTITILTIVDNFTDSTERYDINVGKIYAIKFEFKEKWFNFEVLNGTYLLDYFEYAEHTHPEFGIGILEMSPIEQLGNIELQLVSENNSSFIVNFDNNFNTYIYLKALKYGIEH